jgi:Pyridine nucleotide-disulphide oxidoreductase
MRPFGSVPNNPAAYNWHSLKPNTDLQSKVLADIKVGKKSFRADHKSSSWGSQARGGAIILRICCQPLRPQRWRSTVNYRGRIYRRNCKGRPSIRGIAGLSAALDPAGADRLGVLGIEIVRDEVRGLIHQDKQLVGVSTESGAQIPCDAAWIATGLRAASGLAASLCDVDEAGFATTDEHGRTSRPGVFAVGNATNPIAHLAHAAAAGTNVGPWVTTYLLELLLSEKRAATTLEGSARDVWPQKRKKRN